MPDETRGKRLVEDVTVERDGTQIYLDMRFTRPKGKPFHHLRRLNQF